MRMPADAAATNTPIKPSYSGGRIYLIGLAGSEGQMEVDHVCGDKKIVFQEIFSYKFPCSLEDPVETRPARGRYKREKSFLIYLKASRISQICQLYGCDAA